MTSAQKELFGNGRLTGCNQEELEMFYNDISKNNWSRMADYLGESEGCPVVPTIKEERGVEDAAQMYGRLLYLRTEMLHYIKIANPQWYQDLTETKARNAGEPAGKYDKGWVPDDHEKFVRGPATLNSYNLPRLMSEFLGSDEEHTAERDLLGYKLFFAAIDNSTKNQHTPTQLIVNIAEYFARQDNNPLKYVRRLLSLGKLNEDNQYQEFQETVYAMTDLDSSLWIAYSTASNEFLKQKGIASFNQIFPNGFET